MNVADAANAIRLQLEGGLSGPDLAPVLAELRFLNQGLFGRDATGAQLDANALPTMGGAMYVRSLDAQGELTEALPLAAYLQRKVGRANSNTSLEDYALSTFLATEVVRDSITTNSAPDGSLLRRINEKLGTLNLGETHEEISLFGAARRLIAILATLEEIEANTEPAP